MLDENSCRLCADSKESFLQIYDEDGYKLSIEMKINKYLQIQVCERDALPKSVCWDCYSKLEQCSNFVINCQNAQVTLSQKVFSTYTDETSLKEEIFSNDALFQSAEYMTFPDERAEKNINIPNSFQCGNSDLNSNIECYFSKPTDCLFEGSSRNVDILTVTNNIDNNSTNIDCSQTVHTLRKKAIKKKRTITNRISVSNSPLSRCKRKPSHKRKILSKKKTDSIMIISEGELDEFYVESLREKHFSNIPWLCTECDENFPTAKELQYHHENCHLQSCRFMCPYCYKVYMQYRGFASHLERHQHSSEFVCDRCSKMFPNKKLLERHISSHSNVGYYPCKDCGKSFKHLTGLSAHHSCHLSTHAKIEYACDQCDKVFSTKPNLVTHKKIHSGLRNYVCDLCGKGFIQKGNLCAHMLTHSDNKPFTCETCNKEFKTRIHLHKHRSVHSGKKPHQCDICGRMFRERGTLKEHYRIHTGAMPFSCEYCGKSFRFKGVLTTHRRQHTGERPYSCVECQHHFTNWPNYNKHMKRRHGINKSQTTCLKTDPAVDDSINRGSEKIFNKNITSMDLSNFENTLSSTLGCTEKNLSMYEQNSSTDHLSSSFLISNAHYNNVATTQSQSTIVNSYYNVNPLQMINSSNQIIEMMNADLHRF